MSVLDPCLMVAALCGVCALASWIQRRALVWQRDRLMERIGKQYRKVSRKVEAS